MVHKTGKTDYSVLLYNSYAELQLHQALKVSEVHEHDHAAITTELHDYAIIGEIEEAAWCSPGMRAFILWLTADLYDKCLCIVKPSSSITTT